MIGTTKLSTSKAELLRVLMALPEEKLTAVEVILKAVLSGDITGVQMQAFIRANLCAERGRAPSPFALGPV